MPATAAIYASWPAKLANKQGDWDSDAAKVALCTPAYVPSQTGHVYFSDITNELVALGYVAGGELLGTRTVTLATLSQLFDAPDTTWPALGGPFRYAVVYIATGVAATSPLICYIDFGVDQDPDGAPFVIQWASTGVWLSTVLAP